MSHLNAAITETVKRQVGDVRYFGDFRPRLFSITIEVDPVHGIETLSVFTDDGRGNGDQVFEIGMADLSAGILNEVRRKFGVGL